MYRLAILLTLMVYFTAPSNADTANEENRVIFNTYCGTCHRVEEGDHRLGPSLYGIFGREAGKATGYGGYSGSLTGLTWDEETLDKFMADPKAVASGTTMIFPPLTDPEPRKKIIEYLKSASAPK